MIHFPRRRRLRGNRARATILILSLSTTGCGYLGQPLYPLANVPQRITDLAAVERGSFIVAHFTIPTLTTENNPIQKSVRIDLRAGEAGTQFNPNDWANQARNFSQFEVKDGLATFRIPAQEWIGKRVTIGVRSIGANGKRADWSNFETLPIVSPPHTPSKLEVQNAPGGVRITWTGAGDQFRVWRRFSDEKEFSVATTVPGNEWTDTAIEYGKPYSYEVQALVDAGSSKTAESDISESATILPKDVFPPAVPASLRADRTGTGVSLVWEPDADTDLAGYRVYRSEGNGAWQKLADTNTVPSYSDTTAERGKIYHYAVSAFDKVGNESDRSAPVEQAIP